VLTGCW